MNCTSIQYSGSVALQLALMSMVFVRVVKTRDLSVRSWNWSYAILLTCFLISGVPCCLYSLQNERGKMEKSHLFPTLCFVCLFFLQSWCFQASSLLVVPDCFCSVIITSLSPACPTSLVVTLQILLLFTNASCAPSGSKATTLNLPLCSYWLFYALLCYRMLLCCGCLCC